MEENNNYSPENITLKLNIYPEDTTESDKFTVKSNCTDVVKVELDPSSTEEDIKYKFIPQHPGQTLVVTKATDGSMTTNELVVNVTSSRPIEVNNLTYYRDSSLDKYTIPGKVKETAIWPYKAHAFYGDTRPNKIVYKYNNIYYTIELKIDIPPAGTILSFIKNHLDINKQFICQMVPNDDPSLPFDCNILCNESEETETGEVITKLKTALIALKDIYDYEVIALTKIKGAKFDPIANILRHTRTQI